MAGNVAEHGESTRKQQEVLYVMRSSLPPFEEFMAEVAPLWDTHMLTNMGPIHDRFQQALEDALGIGPCVLFANGHSALELLLGALDLQGEVITTPFTFASTTHAIVRAGLKPVMCDVQAEDATLDAALLESLITDRTCAIVPVHVYGNVCDVDAIQSVADRHGLKVVYDAAHAFGEQSNGLPVPAFGDASMVSFHATKVFNSVEGGAAFCNGNEVLRERLELLKNFGIADKEHVEAIGANAKMSELHAAMGLCNLRHFSEHVAARRKAYERYCARLADVASVRVLSRARDGATSNYSYFAILVGDEAGVDRDRLYDALAERGIHARKYFYPCTNAYACYRGVLDPGATPVAQRLSRQVLCLPLSAYMDDGDVDRVCNVVADVLG